MFERWHLVFKQAEYAALCGHHANEIAFCRAAHRQPGGTRAFSQAEHHRLEAHGTGKQTHAARRMLNALQLLEEIKSCRIVWAQIRCLSMFGSVGWQ